MDKDAWIERCLESLPFVQWDRFIPFDEGITVYGWIDREGDYKDFLLIYFYPAEREIWWSTSSVERHDEIFEILHGEEAEAGNSCYRVEDRFDIENMVELTEQG